MEPFTTLNGAAAPLMRGNIDTDVIIRIERLTAADQSMLGHYAFEALRYKADGSDNPDFILNQAPFRGAPILIAGSNFGCGSSREGAVTALLELGIRCVIADSFGDIFFSNCFQNGLLPIRLPEPVVSRLAQRAAFGVPLTVDLITRTISVAGEVDVFDIDPHRRESLLAGLDDIGLSLKQMDSIREWQDRDRIQRPWVWSVDPTH
jgi:3-isopropylmalate/(R)-2-methylmalate dehydratase small subunit